ncbi:LysR family transcriptional regulator [Microbacterium sediminis]|uniref:Uncharacterized protein n=1 Tax=Microbacterium sediminis TaxID=904291 RepID=A0A1B9NJ17_9MICO|nr:LysR family transcriptional regulator [Microbacterium sediminis]OCG76581.1 hypothetical protein A7J15_11400 [Microbacterium sediminis]QBR73815.1 LysR family transcriptional regulator [Microbacterium sediminis]
MSHRSADGLDHLPLWRTFLAVHASGSVSGAARTLGITQPTVTAQLQALERIVGARLFDRGARGVTPTPLAEDLASRLAAPFTAVAAALAGVDADAQPPVRVGAAAELLAEIAMPALAPLVAQGVRVRAVPGLSADLVDGVRAGALDLTIATERPAGRRVAAEPLTDETFVLVTAPGVVPDGAGSPEVLEALPLLAYAHDVPILRRYWRHAFGRRLEREPALIAPDLRALRAAAMAGAGLAALPHHLCRDALADGRLVDVHPTDDPPINTLYLVTRAGAVPPHVERVRAALSAAIVTALA